MPTINYTYNGDGQRVQIDDGTNVRNLLWDGENVLQEYDASTGATQVTYTHEPAGYGRLISQHRGSTTRWYHFDALGSTRALSNDAGTATDTYVYRAFGKIEAQTGSTTNPFRWVGELGYYYDTEREAYHLRARAYSPTLGRFLSRDPLNSSLYVYASNTPTLYVDPTGLEEQMVPPRIQPGQKPGFRVGLKDCNTSLRELYPECCCTDVQIFYYPSIREQARYSRICLRVWVRTREERALWFDLDTGWHFDPPQETIDLICWAKNARGTTESAQNAHWLDVPGGGPIPGRYMASTCWPVGHLTRITQEWEVCAIGESGTIKTMIGCVRYSHECTIHRHGDVVAGDTGPPLCFCDISCSHVRTGDGSGIPGTPPLNSPKEP